MAPSHLACAPVLFFTSLQSFYFDDDSDGNDETSHVTVGGSTQPFLELFKQCTPVVQR
jgi:hypothetical protein